jgi:diguanylate cyclase (GGDEF)-like protein
VDALTAGAALSLVQIAVALVMAGIFTAIPAEKCTRYWAWSGALMAVGVMIVVFNAGRPNYLLLIVGNYSLIAGVLLQWWGVQIFYRRPLSPAGWATLFGFFASYAALLIYGAEVALRAALSGTACAILYAGIMCSIVRNAGRRWTFGTFLGFTGAAMIAGASLYRAYASYAGSNFFLPMTNSSVGVAVVYLTPLVGTQVLAMALLLLYFERMVKRKDYLATHDDLTGLMNRRAVIAAAEREIGLSARTGLPMSVAYIDVDHFKRINDQYGHEAGDRVLAGIAQILVQTCRRIDLSGRYGGEEFCIIFPGIGAQQAVAAGTRLLDAVRGERFGNVGTVTVSIGIAELPADPAHRQWNVLMKAADEALYAAKARGRDRICLASPDGVPAEENKAA